MLDLIIFQLNSIQKEQYKYNFSNFCSIYLAENFNKKQNKITGSKCYLKVCGLFAVESITPKSHSTLIKILEYTSIV